MWKPWNMRCSIESKKFAKTFFWCIRFSFRIDWKMTSNQLLVKQAFPFPCQSHLLLQNKYMETRNTKIENKWYQVECRQHSTDVDSLRVFICCYYFMFAREPNAVHTLLNQCSHSSFYDFVSHRAEADNAKSSHEIYTTSWVGWIRKLTPFQWWRDWYRRQDMTTILDVMVPRPMTTFKRTCQFGGCRSWFAASRKFSANNYN